jgi:hypothetical protein
VKFAGEIKFPDIDHPGVPIQFVVDGSQAELIVEGESLGRWSLYDVRAKRLVASAFEVDLDGTEVTFVAADPIDFAYRGVEHMAQTWATIKSKRVPTRTIAVRKSRKGTKPSRVEELRAAMEANLEQPGPRPIAGEPAMPASRSRVTKRLRTSSGEPAQEGFASDWDRRNRARPTPAGGEGGVPTGPTPADHPTGTEGEGPAGAKSEAELSLEAEKQALAEERARLEEERRAAEQREANLIEAYRLEVERLEAEREELRRQAAEAAEQAAAQGAVPGQAAKETAERAAGEERTTAEREAAARAELERQAMEREERERQAREREAAVQAELDRRIAEREAREREAAEREAAERRAREAEERERAERELARQEEAAEFDVATVGVEEAGTTSPEPESAGDRDDVDLDGRRGDGEEGPIEAMPHAPEPSLTGAPKEKSGSLMGAVKAAFRGGSKDHEHRFVEAPGGIGITRYVCEECGQVSISV